MPRFTLHAVAVLGALLLVVGASAAELVSVGSSGAAFPGSSGEPTISADGRFVAFSTTARLLPEDANALRDVYVRDRVLGTTRLVSDSRGGDQPIMAGRGRFVIFRVVGAFSKLRIADLDSLDPPRTISFPSSVDFSFHYADTAVISPEGRFVTFPFQAVRGFFDDEASAGVYSVERDPSADGGFTTQEINPVILHTLGRCVQTNDGNVFFVETSDGIAPRNDLNGVQDIYKFDRNDQSFVRLSDTQDAELLDQNGFEFGLEARKPARSPVLSGDGGALYYLSERRLRVADADRTTSLYRNVSSDGFLHPAFVPTPGIRPLALSRQAVGSGRFVVFLGQKAGQVPRAWVLRTSDGSILPVAGAGQVALGAPVISADDSTIAFATSTALSTRDHNLAGDVYATPNPFDGATLDPPAVTLAPSTDREVTAGAQFQQSASATAASGIVYTTIELDGVEVARSNSGSVTAPVSPQDFGLHTIRALALDRNGIIGLSAPVSYIVKPGANSLRLRGVVGLTRTGVAAGGAESFTGSVQVDNTFNSFQSNLRVLVVEDSVNVEFEEFSEDFSHPLSAPERVLQIVPLDVAISTSISKAGPTSVSVSGTTRAPEVIGATGFQGLGYVVLAQLQQFTSGAWQDQGPSLDLFTVLPRLNEETPGPNGGIGLANSENGEAGFNPATISGLAISGNANVFGQASRQYLANATFSSGSPKQVAAQWSVLNAGPGDRISSTGLFTAGLATVGRTVTLQAVFHVSGLSSEPTATFPVNVRPRLAVVSVRALTPLVQEGATGTFRIVRSAFLTSDLAVNFEMSGLANRVERGNDDYPSPGSSVTIPAGQTFVDVPIASVTDSNLEGNESVILTLQPSGEYLLGPIKAAALTIDDADDAAATDLADATIRLGAGRVIGAKVYAFQDARTSQIIPVNVSAGQTVSFTVGLINRGANSLALTIGGATASYQGFVIRYFLGPREVTASVLDGSIDLHSGHGDFAPGTGVNLTMRVTCTAAAPLGSSAACLVDLNEQDRVEADVKRVR